MYCIAGADGFFGSYIQRMLLACGEKVIALNHRSSVFPDSESVINLRFDITDNGCFDAAEKLLSRFSDINMIYLIAMHSPDAVKADPVRAKKINGKLYSDFLNKISMCDIKKLYYSSSDTVYGESIDGNVFTEHSPLCPVNAYGEQKAEAERITLANGFSVARFPYMYAPSVCHKKHFFDELTETLISGRQIHMFTDYVRSSLTYPQAAEYLYGLIKTDTDERIFNICADSPCSKYDIGLAAADCCGADRALVVPELMDASGVFTEKRAKAIIMSNRLLKKTLGMDVC